MRKKITAAEFAEKIHNLFEGRLTVIQETFKGMKHKVSVKCNIHNCIFTVYAYSLSIKDTNCPLCGKEIRHKHCITPWNDILKRFRKKYGNRFSYDETTYNGYKTKMKVICNKCGSEFWIKPEHHLKYNNGGCPICHLTVTATCSVCGAKFEVDRRQNNRKNIMCPECRKIVERERTKNWNNNHKRTYIRRFIRELRLKKVQLLDGSYIEINSISASKLYYENKISFDTIKECFPKLIRVCVICGKEFVRKVINTSSNLSNATTCSEECLSKLRTKRCKENYLKVKAAGRFKGWTTRKINSYAEQYWMRVLDNLNISYIREFHFERYFLDFKIDIGDIKLDLEIDGKQHKYRVEHDKERDKFLTENGFTVYRIPWNTVNTDNGKQQMNEKINKFVEFYNSLCNRLLNV